MDVVGGEVSDIREVSELALEDDRLAGKRDGLN